MTATWRQRDVLEPLLRAGVESALPRVVMPRRWPTDLSGPLALLAVGKASADMAAEACRVAEFSSGLVIGVEERLASVALPTGIARLAADHPLPTERNVEAARAARRFVGELNGETTLVACLSGGASAHLCLPVAGVSLHDLRSLTEALLRAGATIEELNTVRKHAEEAKGGRLASACRAQRVEVLAISDVQGDRLEVIGSGPFAPDPSTFADALGVLEARRVLDVAPAITRHLERGSAGEAGETPKAGDACFSRVRSRIVASNTGAREAVRLAAEARGLAVTPSTLPEYLTGEARDVAGRLVVDMASAWERARSQRRRQVMVWGGEPTVTVGASGGRGGRCSEVALACAVLLDGRRGVTFGALATDGADGNSGAAGAVVDGWTASRALAAGHDPLLALAKHDSGGLFAATGGQLVTGPTGTNVNDLFVAFIEPD